MADFLGKQNGRILAGGSVGRMLLLFLAAVLPGLILLGGCQQQEATKVEAVTFCGSTTALLPLLVAEKQGFFPEQRLMVTAREFTMGREALEGMFKGECDFATAAEPPVVEYAMQRDDFRILGALQSSDNQNRIVARADRGIARPMDLRGKRIATTKGTSAHYFLELFLERYGLTSKDVIISFMKADELLGALTSGQIDAIVMTNKVITLAQEALQANAVLFEEPGLYRNYYLLLATAGLLEKRPKIAVQVLRALAQAEEFIRQRPEETLALAMTSRSQKISSGEIKQLLGLYQYHLTLDHALLMGLEDTARWLLPQTGDGQGAVPNFLNLMTVEPLRAVIPDGVRLEK